MSIKFICSCGKHLRARDEMAARRSMCPRCGAPVGIPSLRPTHAGTAAAPMTPQERIRRILHQRPGSVAADDPAANITIPPLPEPETEEPKAKPSRRRARRIRRMEKHWYHALVYPLLNWGSLHLFALLLTTLTAVSLLESAELWPLLTIRLRGWSLPSPILVLPLLLFAYIAATIECALSSALAGDGPGLYWPGWRVENTLKSGVRWLVSFLAGPVLLLAVAGYFWLYGGDLTVLDWLIMAELCVVALGYWFLLIVSMTERNALVAANPLSVARLVARLRYRAAVAALLISVVALAHAWVGFFAASKLHASITMGVLLLVGDWWSALFWAMFVFRLVGVWCYRTPAAGGGP